MTKLSKAEVRAQQPLQNERWEKFAQCLAEGTSQITAHKLAGFTPNQGNASTLSRTPEVAARIAVLREEFQEKMAEINASEYDQQVRDLADNKLVMNKQYIQTQLIKNLGIARVLGNLKEANAALKLLGETCQAFEPDPKDGKLDGRKTIKHDPDARKGSVSLLAGTLEDVEHRLGDVTDDAVAVTIDDRLNSTEADPVLKPR